MSGTDASDREAPMHRQTPNAPAPTECPCVTCLHAAGVSIWWMVVCEECGNKRCPHATSHHYPCTKSNAPGQLGSRYAETPDAHDAARGATERDFPCCEVVGEGSDAREAREAGLRAEVERLREDLAEARAEVERLQGEVERLHAWDGLMSLLDEHWPDDIFPTSPDQAARDGGPRIVSLLRRISAVREIHEPVDALNYHGSTARQVQVCSGCGTDDGNWQRWPCPTARALGVAQ